MVAHSLLTLLILSTAATSAFLVGRWGAIAKERLHLSHKIRHNYEGIALRRISHDEHHELSTLLKHIQDSKALSSECLEDIVLLASADAGNNYTAGLYNMLDSSAGIGTGFIKGNFLFHGYLTECTSIDVPVEGRVRRLMGGYFREKPFGEPQYLTIRLGIDYLHDNNTEPGACTNASAHTLNFRHIPMENVGPFYSGPNQGPDVLPELGHGKYRGGKLPFVAEESLVLTFDKCLPLSCSSAELQEVLNPINGQSSIPNAVCFVQKMNDDVPEPDAPYYIVLIFICTIAAVSVVSGLVDIFLGEYLSESAIAQTLLWKILMSFSLYSNVSTIFDGSSLNKSGQIGPLHCIRFFSMVWVVICHFAAFTLTLFDNPSDFIDMLPNVFSHFITNGYPAVDTFFFLSGLLVSFIWFKMYKTSPRNTNSLGGWAMFYVHRILRLSPPFYISVIFSTFVFDQWFRDVPYNMNNMYSPDACKNGWWVNLLYIHNFVKDQDQCTGLAYTWYLGTDLQMFLFSPLILLPMALKPVIGWIIAVIFIVLSTATNIFLVYHFHWPANAMFLGGTVDPEITIGDEYAKLMYSAPYIRCQASRHRRPKEIIYIIGMLTGWVMQYKRSIRIPKLLSLGLWLLACALMLAVILGLHEEYNGHYIEIFWRAMYSSLSRVAWGLGLAWIVIACWYGYGGPINTFMSWYIWAPLGRLSYCAYLMHIPVIMFVLGQSTDGLVYTTFLEWIMIRIVPCVFLSFIAAVLWSAFFEISFGKIEMLLLGGFGAKRRREKEDSHNVEKEEETNAYNITPVPIEKRDVVKERL